jgi:hypothetical protein
VSRKGQFLTQDSFLGFSMDPRSLHKYAYTHNDPINNVDPSGHSTLPELVTTQNINMVLKMYDIASFAVDIYTGGAGGVAADLASEVVLGKMARFGPVARIGEKAMALFSRIWDRGGSISKRLKLSGEYSSDDLRHNMSVLFDGVPANHSAHHLVSKSAPNATRRLKELGINPNSPSNGVMLPNQKGLDTTASYHGGRHCPGYHTYVDEMLSAAIDKEDAVSRLSLVRMNLLTGEIPLQYCR